MSAEETRAPEAVDAENAELRTRLLRMEVAAEKGEPQLGRWLQGTTREEIEADADEFFADARRSRQAHAQRELEANARAGRLRRPRR